MKCQFCEKPATNEKSQLCAECAGGHLQDLESSIAMGLAQDYYCTRKMLVKHGLGDFTREEWDTIDHVIYPFWSREECDEAFSPGGPFYEGKDLDLNVIYEESKVEYQEYMKAALPIIKRLFAKSQCYCDAKYQCKESNANYSHFCLTLLRTICSSLGVQ